jgi:hypothetical protein
MGLENYLNFTTGFFGSTQYTYLFAMSFNPVMFKLFKLRHFAFIAVGIILSMFNHRAIFPFLLLALLDLDYTKLTPKDWEWAGGFFLLSSLILLVFGGASYA